MQPSQNTLATQSLAKDAAPVSPIALNTVVRRLNLIRTILIILEVLTFLSLALSFYQILFASQNDPIYLISGIAWVIIFGGCYLLVSPKLSRQLRAEPTPANLHKATVRVDIISLVVVSILILAETLLNLLSTSESYVLAGFLVIPVVGAFVGLGQQQTTIIAIVTGIALAVCIIVNQPVGTNSGLVLPLTGWLITYVAIAVCIIIFTRRITTALRLVEEEKERTRQLLDIVSSTTAVGYGLSRELSQMSTELTVAAEQQASSTQEQMAALTQVTSSLEELGETAQQIAINATAVAEASRQSVEIAGTVEGTGDLVVTTSVEGTHAVEQTNTSVRQVRNRIEILGQRLLNLTEQTKRVGNIIELIDEIANETHLLALNASIEAAGSVDGNTATNGAGSRQGERFGVIAQEIKNLSDRSREATEEIRQAIAEMQGAVAAAVLVAEEGKKDTAGALMQSEVAGKVIARLHEVILGSTDSAITIRQAFQEFQERCTEIKLATNQQQSANQQILYTMRSLGDVWRQTAADISQLSQNSGRVQDQLVSLNTVLAEANMAQKNNEAVALVAK
jgi:methyl-accepting chemotaxis protein